MANMQSFFWIGLGGGLGSVLRFILVSSLKSQSLHFPWGTLAVNCLGSVAMGASMGLVPKIFPNWDQGYSFFSIGLLGGFTTFSAFSMEASILIQSGRLPAAVAYSGVSVVLGCAGIFLGQKIFIV